MSCCEPGCCSSDKETVDSSIKERYSELGRAMLARQEAGQSAGCGCGPISEGNYDGETDAPQAVLATSLGCGNPSAMADIEAGDRLLDLGSGGGLDLALFARRVGPDGHVYGVDQSDDMIELATRNLAAANVENATLLKGDIAGVPLEDNTVDVITSNCVINLATDKQPVFNEAFRLLRPGGRFAVFDVISRRELPAEIRSNMKLWGECLGGALLDSDYQAGLEAAGFVDVRIDVERVYSDAACRELTGREDLGGALASAFISARKPV